MSYRGYSPQYPQTISRVGVHSTPHHALAKTTRRTGATRRTVGLKQFKWTSTHRTHFDKQIERNLPFRTPQRQVRYDEIAYMRKIPGGWELEHLGQTEYFATKREAYARADEYEYRFGVYVNRRG